MDKIYVSPNITVVVGKCEGVLCVSCINFLSPEGNMQSIDREEFNW